MMTPTPEPPEAPEPAEPDPAEPEPEPEIAAPEPTATTPPTTHVAVSVTRTGGIAGMKRTWRGEPPAEESARWTTLIDACGWTEASARAGASAAGTGSTADRFIWFIRAEVRVGARDDTHEAELPDHALSGPWRDLVDAVRAAAKSARPTPPAAG